MNFIKKYWSLGILFLLSFLLFFFKLNTSISFEGDLGRDFYEIAKISFGNITLLGPKGSFGGIYTAPYHFYLFLPFFIIFQRSLTGLILFNVLLFTFSICFLSYFISKKFGKLTGLLSGLFLTLIPFIVFSARNPGNGFTPIAFFMVFLTIIYFFDLNKFNYLKITALGFLLGFILSMQFAYAILVLPILFFIFFLLKNKKIFVIFLIGMCLAFSPLILFELKNNFIMFKNTFIDKSYLSFMNNTNLPNAVNLNKNVFVNALDLANKMTQYFNINILLVFSLLSLTLIWIKNNKERLLILITFMSYIILTLLLRFQYSAHYFFPFLALLSFTLIVILANLKYKNIIFLGLISLQIIFFPKALYANSIRNYDLLKQRVEKILSKKLIKTEEKFNVFLKRNDGATTPAGNEYRYFLLINGYTPQSEFLYKNSDKLLLLSEEKIIDINKMKSWEINEFDLAKVKKTTELTLDSTMYVYLLEK